ncbi:MAG TPA: GNAT family N-acetyltransferase [Solirubrobacteraceae bacterium]|nr:GNAT family N-acetyltransferase [Solirubrobacteraceae bacterium]
MIALRPLREDEYAAWDAAHRAEYARGLVAHAGMSREDAEAKVERDVAGVLPDGLATPGTLMWAVEEDGRVVGTVFVGLRDGGAWLYDITIDEPERGRGCGRAAMIALEAELRALGHTTVGLNVWGGNAVARSLYRSLGWAEESVHMRKRL